MENGNVKETINLLDLSDNESDLSDLIFPPVKKKKLRRYKNVKQTIFIIFIFCLFVCILYLLFCLFLFECNVVYIVYNYSRHRQPTDVKVPEDSCYGCSRSQIKLISLWLAATLFTFWLVVLSLLAVIIYTEFKRMDNSIKQGTFQTKTKPFLSLIFFKSKTFLFQNKTSINNCHNANIKFKKSNSII